MSNYTRGAYFERSVMKQLTALGFYCVRSAGSHGVFDIIALLSGAMPLMIQCKTDGRVDPEERASLWRESIKAGAWAVRARRVNKNTIFDVLNPDQTTWRLLIPKIYVEKGSFV